LAVFCPRTALADAPKRILCLDYYSMEILCDLGAQDRIVGVAKLKPDFPFYNLLKDRPWVKGGMREINVEQVIALSPDLVFCWSGNLESLRSRGLRVYPIRTYDVEGVAALVETIGAMVGLQEKGRLLAADMRKRLQRLESKIRAAKSRPQVYFEANAMGKSRGPGCLANDLIQRAGGINIAGKEPVAFPQLSQEFILSKNPDVILVEEYGAKPADLCSRRGWEVVSAVKNRRVYVSLPYFTGYTPRCLDALEAYARWFHPEIDFGIPAARVKTADPP
jgi:iron complex transport system substrate-binding protein